MDKIIRATITIEVPYDNELLNYGSKLDQKLREVIDRTKHLSCSVQAGNLEPSTEPVLERLKTKENIWENQK